MLTFSAPRRLTPSPLLAALALTAAIVVGGCGSGGGSSDGSANPAGVVPATAPLYIEATIPVTD